MPDELTKALLLAEAASPQAVAQALFTSVTAGLPLVQTLTESGAVSADALERFLARAGSPFLRQVGPVLELVARLPPGLCARLLAIPVRRDAITGTVDVVVADPTDLHPAKEIAFHLGAPVRVVRATVSSIEEALRGIRSLSGAPPAAPDDERRSASRSDSHARPRAMEGAFRSGTLPPPDGVFRVLPTGGLVDALSSEALRPSRVPSLPRQAHVVPGAGSSQRRTSVTPPWGTQVHSARSVLDATGSEPPKSGLGSEIPIPLMRRTFTAVSGGTQRPPALVDPRGAMGEGYAVDAGNFRQIVEVNERARNTVDRGPERASPGPSFIPGLPPLPGTRASHAYAAQNLGGILAALRAAGSRDEVLELLLMGARMVALRVAVFVVKRDGYRGWACTPELGERASLQAVLVPLETPSIFDEAARDGLYLGPIRPDEAHAALLHAMRGASRDVAVVPIRVSGRTVVVVLADELGDALLASRRLEELGRAAGDAFTRIVKMRR